MPVNTLASEAGIKIGPILLETLVKHYFERTLNGLHHNGLTDKGLPQLRQDELLYDEAFNIVKAFLEASTKHPVEELQRFSNMRTPAPPWVYVVKVYVPMSCCDDAATYLIKALGGEENTKRLVGGTKWWQVRGVKGVAAEWIASKKDWNEAEKRFKAHEKERSSTVNDTPRPGDFSEGVHPEASARYQPEMDEMRCILYAHGGGYYFGSVDQERYSIQRHARKIRGRVFATNYRLAPQYPFPCAIQDLLASYLFLIQPPEGASHRPVKPEHIVIAGDSAGGGLCIALLQVLRDTGLPMPAGGVLISPWCDLTHSFPSIHLNTATDVIPPYGLSLYKPSTLWPPPPDEVTTEVQESLRSRIRHVVSLAKVPSRRERRKSLVRTPTSPDIAPPEAALQQRDSHANSQDQLSPPASAGYDVELPQTGRTLHLGSTATLPLPEVRNQSISCQTADGKTLTIDDQIHLYAPNYLLGHPLISPVVSYMGGLPPLFIIASDKEVLRDEIIYLAHKAAYPDKYPIGEEVRAMYPALIGIEERYGPTKVHLQVYDDTAHVLPVLFSFTTPAKYCYRAIATFIKHVTGILPTSVPEAESNDDITIPFVRSPEGSPSRQPSPPRTPNGISAPPAAIRSVSSPVLRNIPSLRHRSQTVQTNPSLASASKVSLRRALSTKVASMSAALDIRLHHVANGDGRHPREASADIAGPRFQDSTESETSKEGVRTAGEPSVYANGIQTMIRERVSTRGIVRPLESESELASFRLPPELIGVVSELAMRRYLEGKAKFDKKFHHTTKTIARHRRRNFNTAKKDAMRNMALLQTYVQEGRIHTGSSTRAKSLRQALAESGSWSWAWALDLDEHPPPSSIVSRRDTDEAVELGRIADQAVFVDEHMMTGNNLWSMVVNFLTVGPDKKTHHAHHIHHRDHSSGPGDHMHDEKELKSEDRQKSKRERFRSMFAHFSKEHCKRSHSSSASPSPIHSRPQGVPQ